MYAYFVDCSFCCKLVQICVTKALFPVPGGPETYKQPPFLSSMQLFIKDSSSSFSFSRPTSCPASAPRVNTFFASLKTDFTNAEGVVGVRGVRGVPGPPVLPPTRTRCLGVTGHFLDRESRWRGVLGVGMEFSLWMSWIDVTRFTGLRRSNVSELRTLSFSLSSSMMETMVRRFARQEMREVSRVC